MHDWIDAGGGDVRVARPVPIFIKQSRLPNGADFVSAGSAPFALAKDNVMVERIDPSLRYIRVSCQIPSSVEIWPRITPFGRAPLQIMYDRIHAGRGHIRIALPVPALVKQRGCPKSPRLLGERQQKQPQAPKQTALEAERL